MMYIYTSRVVLTIINFIFGLIELILLLRIVLELFAANPLTPFVSWTYSVSTTLLYPFQGIFPSPVLRGGFVLDISAIVALLVYTIIAYLISELIRFISYRATTYTTVEETRRR